MLAKSGGRQPKHGPRGGVFRVQRGRLEPGAGTLRAMSREWTDALDRAAAALVSGKVAAAVGEPGTGRATLLGQAIRQVHPGSRILCAAVPAPRDVEAWLSLWTPELTKPQTAVIVENVDLLPAWAAQELSAQAVSSRVPAPDGGPAAVTWAVTAAELAAIPAPLATLVESVVPVPALRDRSADVMPLARYAARQARMREVDFTPAADRALTAYGWPGNVDELFGVVQDAALRAETIDVRHLPAALMGRTGPRLTRIEVVERDEIARCLSRPGTTVAAAAAELGISRATIYRRMARLGIAAPR